MLMHVHYAAIVLLFKCFLQMIIQPVFQGSSESDLHSFYCGPCQGVPRAVEKFYFSTVRQNIVV